MRFNTILKLGPNREKTREGFTLFRNVSVSRTGVQVYGPDEGTGIEPGPDGFVYITRTADEIFRAETLDSGNGKSFVILHPDDDVTPLNWRDVTHGVMFNLRRGTGDQKDESVCDVMVYTDDLLREIDLGMREVSLGYDADYFQTGDGRGEQRNIYINHVALVPAGRCGSTCAVRDHAPTHQETNPMKSRLQRVLDALAGTKDDAELRRVIDKARDEEEKNEEEERKKADDAAKAKDKAEEEFKKETRDAIAGLKSTLDTIAKSARDKAKDEEEEAEKKKKEEDEEMEQELEEESGSKDARKAKDSALLSESFENVKMMAEIVHPGVQIPTFDAALDPKKTFRDCHCGLRRKALTGGLGDSSTAEIITSVRGRVLDAAEVAKLSCGQVRTIFNGVAAMKRAVNNGAATRDANRAAAVTQQTTDTLTPTQRFIAAARDRKHGKK